MNELAVVRGFRCYKAIVQVEQRDVALVGAREHIWETSTLQAMCLGRSDYNIRFNFMGTVGYSMTASAVLDEHVIAERHLLTGEHDCGIYVYKAAPYVVRQYGQEPIITERSTYAIPLTVLAQTLLWGAVEEGVKGFRAQYARIESLDILAPASGGCYECNTDHIITTVTRRNNTLKWNCDNTENGRGPETIPKVVNALVAKYQVPVRLLTPIEFAAIYGYADEGD